MVITSLECWNLPLELAEPYQIAYETVDRFDNVILRASTSCGIIGWSCAAPDLVVTGETSDTVMDDFRRLIEPRLKGCDPFRYAQLFTDLRTELSSRRAALAMADMLLYDLMSRKAEVPLYHFLGGFRDSTVTSVTIGILPMEQTLDRAEKMVAAGARSLKLKGGLDVDLDIEKTRRVRERVGPHIQLRFDANQGYGVAEAMRYAAEVSNSRVELIEQPTARELEDQLGELVRQLPLPIMADESLVNLEDAFRLTSRDRADLVNIKLMKVGGITEAMHINSVARSAGVECMVGCLDECELGIAFGLHFCLARPNLEYADLDSFLDVKDDPFRGLVEYRNGRLYPQSDAGIGTPRL